jgi:hypothetical protein
MSFGLYCAPYAQPFITKYGEDENALTRSRLAVRYNYIIHKIYHYSVYNKESYDSRGFFFDKKKLTRLLGCKCGPLLNNLCEDGIIYIHQKFDRSEGLSDSYKLTPPTLKREPEFNFFTVEEGGPLIQRLILKRDDPEAFAAWKRGDTKKSKKAPGQKDKANKSCLCDAEKMTEAIMFEALRKFPKNVIQRFLNAEQSSPTSKEATEPVVQPGCKAVTMTAERFLDSFDNLGEDQQEEVLAQQSFSKQESKILEPFTVRLFNRVGGKMGE